MKHQCISIHFQTKINIQAPRSFVTQVSLILGEMGRLVSRLLINRKIGLLKSFDKTGRSSFKKYMCYSDMLLNDCIYTKITAILFAIQVFIS